MHNPAASYEIGYMDCLREQYPETEHLDAPFICWATYDRGHQDCRQLS